MFSLVNVPIPVGILPKIQNPKLKFYPLYNPIIEIPLSLLLFIWKPVSLTRFDNAVGNDPKYTIKSICGHFRNLSNYTDHLYNSTTYQMKPYSLINP